MSEERRGDAAATTELDGTLTRAQRVEIAQDVIATLRSRQRRIRVGQGQYFAPNKPESLPKAGELHSSKIIGGCFVCARGALFLASVDRYDDCDLGRVGRRFTSQVVGRTYAEWGREQVWLIEATFELAGAPGSVTRLFAEKFYDNRQRHGARDLLIAICENIIANGGVFIPETYLTDENAANASL